MLLALSILPENGPHFQTARDCDMNAGRAGGYNKLLSWLYVVIPLHLREEHSELGEQLLPVVLTCGHTLMSLRM